MDVAYDVFVKTCVKLLYAHYSSAPLLTLVFVHFFIGLRDMYNVGIRQCRV